MNKRKFKKKVKEVRKLMCCGKRKERSNRGLWFGIALAVVTGLVGLVLWLKSRNDEYIEEYYEYFDDDLEDELEDDLYGEEDDDVEYVAIKDFDKEDEVSAEEATEEVVEAEDADEDNK